MKDVSEFVPGKSYRASGSSETYRFIGLSADGKAVMEVLKGYGTGSVFKMCPSAVGNYYEYREPIKGSFWVNIYSNGAAGSFCRSRKDADELADPSRIACIEVHYTEGDGL